MLNTRLIGLKLACIVLLASCGLALGQVASVTQQAAALKSESMRAKTSVPLLQLRNEYITHLTQGMGQPFKSSSRLALIQDGRVVIDAVANRSGEALLTELKGYGLTQGSVYGKVVSGQLPLAAISRLSRSRNLLFANLAVAQTQAGLTTSQGDNAMQGSVARATYGVDGAGQWIGVLSDSFNSLGGAAAGQASGDLPPPGRLSVLLDWIDPGATDEGRAMAEIVYDVAPGSSIAFNTAFVGGQAGFANGIIALKNFGCQTICDDVIYFAEPMFADGIIAQAADTVKASGVAYFSSAGNNNRDAFESDYRDSFSPVYNANVHDWDPGPGVDNDLDIDVLPGSYFIISFQWVDKYASAGHFGGAATDLDFYVFDVTGNIVAWGVASNQGQDPVEVFDLYNPSNVTQRYFIVVSRYSGPAPAYMKFAYFPYQGALSFADPYPGPGAGSLYGHANAAGAVATGASYYWNTPAYGVNPPVLNSYSSAGPTAIYFDLLGNMIGPVLRAKPEVVAPDGVNTTFFGFDAEGDGWPNFFGTSAAAPHAAGVAALMRQAKGNTTPDAIKAGLIYSAIDMLTPGFDYDTGYGLIQADKAIQYFYDFNQDKCVDRLDFNIIYNAIRTGSTDPKFDLNNDGRVNILDARLLVTRFTRDGGLPCN